MSYEIGIGDLQQNISAIPRAGSTGPVQQKTSESAGSGVEAGSAGADQTNLSSIGGLVAQALTVPDTRTAKVAALQQTIAAGQYNVSSSDVAEKLLQSMLE
jgi:negative regulator of flagellin synthesis FlgM